LPALELTEPDSLLPRKPDTTRPSELDKPEPEPLEPMPSVVLELLELELTVPESSLLNVELTPDVSLMPRESVPSEPLEPLMPNVVLLMPEG